MQNLRVLQARGKSTMRAAFTLIELLVVIAIIVNLNLRRLFSHTLAPQKENAA